MTDLEGPADGDRGSPPIHEWTTPALPTTVRRQLGPAGASVIATLATMFVILPGFLVGGLAIFLREDVAFTAAGLGAAVATFFAASVVAALPGGRFSERQGPERALAMAAAVAATCLLLIGSVVETYPALIAALALGGFANGVVHPAANLLLVRRVPHRFQGVAFGIKQAAILLATLVSGLAVPAIALTVGWRWAFLAGGGGALVVAAVGAVATPSRGVRRAGPLRRGDVPLLPMTYLAIAAGLGAGTAVAMGSFLVDAITFTGAAPEKAGWLLAAGSLVAAATRVVSGWLADRALRSPLMVVAAMMAIGALGLVILQVGRPGYHVVGTIVGFGIGWGWHGLLNFAVVNANPNAPGAATAITEAGSFCGAVLMPILFGVVATGWSYRASWFIGAGALIVAALLVSAVQSQLGSQFPDQRT